MESVKIIEYSGLELKKIRKERNISIEEIADSTYINVTYLRYIEDETFNSFPPIVFVKSYLKQFAIALGLDPEETTKSYMERYNAWRENKK